MSAIAVTSTSADPIESVTPTAYAPAPSHTVGPQADIRN